LLGQIPDFDIPAGNRQRTIILESGNSHSPAADSFRVLGARILARMSEAHLKTILITSAEPEVGKSTVVANLAAAMAEAGRQVMVVDGDLQRPQQHEIFGLVTEPGLSDFLLDPTQLDRVVQPTKMERIRAIAVGSVLAGSSELVNAQATAEVMGQIAQAADVVLWDSPPLLAAADAALLAPIADGVILVVEHAQTQQETVQAACQQLADLNAKLIGIVANRTETDGRYNYYYRRPPRASWWAEMKKVFNGKKK
jgi:capsular exopolysaccharide synthesis family protein